MTRAHLKARTTLACLTRKAETRLRRSSGGTTLAAAKKLVAQELGFASWRAVEKELARRRGQSVAKFFAAARSGDTAAVGRMLALDRTLAQARHPRVEFAGWSALHTAAKAGDAATVRLLLQAGADPNAREGGDNSCALHWAAAHGHAETVRLLLEAGADVHGERDLHESGIIGWASLPLASWDGSVEARAAREEVVRMLLRHGARHHVFSAIAMGDEAAIQKLAAEDRQAMERRMSRFEWGQSAVQFARSSGRQDLVPLLVSLGAPPDTGGAKAIGAKTFLKKMAQLSGSVYRGTPMLRVPVVGRALEYYTLIGFRELGRYEDCEVAWGKVAFGNAAITFDLGGTVGNHDTSLWLETTRIEELYAALRARQAAAPDLIDFAEELYEPFYGGRQFSIRDLNGYHLIFLQPKY